MTATFRKTICTVKIDGRTVSNRVSARCTYDLAQRTASAEIVCATSAPSWAQRWSSVTIDMGGTQAGLNRRFTGFLLDFDYTDWPQTVKLVCYGPLIYAEMARNSSSGGTDLSAGGVGATDQAMVTTVLNDCGITDIAINGTGTTLGTVAGANSFTWQEGESGMSFIGKLDDVCLGYRTIDTPGGEVQRVKILIPQSATAALTFTENQDIVSGTNQQTLHDIANQVTVTGYDDGTGVKTARVVQANSAIPAAIGHIDQRIDSPMIERALTTDAGSGLACQDVATWQISQLNQVLLKLQMVTSRDDVIGPGMTIQVNPAGGRLGVPSTNQMFFVQAVTPEYLEDGGFQQTLTCLGGLGNTQPIALAPVVTFSIDLYVETVVIAGVATNLYEVYCQDHSYATQGTITSRAWTADSPGSPASGSDITFTTAYQSSIAGKSVSLTITDSQGNTATETKVITNDQPAASAQTDPIISALSVDGEYWDGASFNRKPDDTAQGVTCCANGPLWGAGTDLLVSTDGLKTTPTEVAIFAASGASVDALWIEEDISPDNCLAGASDGNVAYSTDGGTTWTLCTKADANQVLRVAIDGGAPSHFFRMTAAALWHSYDYGVTWTVLQAAAGGETFRDLCLSFARSMISMSGGRLMIEMTSGTQQTFPALTPAVADVVAVTADIRADRFVCVDSTGRTFYHATAGATAFTQGASIPAGTAQARGLWRSGLVRGVIFLALGTGGLYKNTNFCITSGDYYAIDIPGTNGCPVAANYLQVGCDAQPNQVIPTSGNVFVGTSPAGGSNGGLAVRTAPGIWTQLGVGTVGGVFAMASPKGFADQIYIAGITGNLGTYKFWVTTDGGTTFTDVTATLPCPASSITAVACLDNAQNTVYIASNDATNKGIWKSTNAGSTWTHVFSNSAPSNGIYKTSGYLRSIITNPGNANNIYGYADATDTFAWYAETDLLGGPFHIGIRGDDTVSIAFRSPAAGNFTGYYFTGGLIYTIPTPGSVGFTGGGPHMAVAPDANTMLVLWTGTGKCAVLKGLVTGKTTSPNVVAVNWSQPLSLSEAVPASPGMPALLVDPTNGNNWWLGTTFPNVHYSTDDAVTWQSESVTGLTTGTLTCMLVTG